MSSELSQMMLNFSPLLILWAAVILNLLLPLSYSAHPARLWHQFAQLLASKVNSHRSYQQDSISGALACTLMLFPTLALLIALQTLAWQAEYFQLALLFLALDWRNQNQLANKMGNWLSREDKDNARQELASLLNRDVNTLSLLGAGKATVETLIAGQSRQVISVMFWFALSGGIGAFIYRLICELHRAWSPSQPIYRPFGLATAQLLLILEWLPVRLFLLLLITGRNAGQIYSLAKREYRSWISPSQGLLLSAIGHKLQLSLGGPALYQNLQKSNIKAVRAKLGGRIAPAALHLSQVMQLLNQRTLLWLVLQSLVMFIFLWVVNA